MSYQMLASALKQKCISQAKITMTQLQMETSKGTLYFMNYAALLIG